jgi:hypothetical protein
VHGLHHIGVGVDCSKLVTWHAVLLQANLRRTLCDIVARWRKQHELPRRSHRGSDAPCVPINEPSFGRPDFLDLRTIRLMACRDVTAGERMGGAHRTGSSVIFTMPRPAKATYSAGSSGFDT